MALDDTGSAGIVRYTIRTPDPGVNTIATEFALAALLQRARRATGLPVTPVRMTFAHPAPSSYRELAETFGTERIDFDAEVSTMTFGQRDLHLPLVRADPVLARILRGRADIELSEPERVPEWIVRFRQVLAECLDERTPLLGAAARRMTVSPRTLQRLLEREGTTWRAEVDAARREQAARLQRTGLSKSQAAARLGYSDVRALRRAARRWERR